MDGIICLTESQRKTALEHFRFGDSARLSRRSHILMLLDRGWSYRQIMDAMLCGSDTIADAKKMLPRERSGICNRSHLHPKLGSGSERYDLRFGR
jgi:hypothetical protein